MRVSIIVCTYNRAKSLIKCLDSIALSLTTASPLAAEIVVVDNASTDNTGAVVGSWAETTAWPVRVVTENTRGLSSARNCGIRSSQGQLLLLTDDDCCLHPAYVKELLYCDDHDRDLVLRGGPVELGDPNDLPISIITRSPRATWSRAANSARHMNLGDTLIGCNLAMRREVAEIVGPFDVRLGAGSRIPGGEDMDYIFRAYLAGVSIEYVPALLVYHYHGRRAVAEGKRLFQNYSIGGGALFAKYAVKAPVLCLPLWWDIKNTVREMKCGSNLFMPSLEFAYKDKLKWYAVGAVRFMVVSTIGLMRQMAPSRGYAHMAPTTELPPTEKPPIFIVGVPRSGTTLLAAMLSAHSQFSCGPESHVFRALSDDIEKAQSSLSRRVSRLMRALLPESLHGSRMTATEKNLCEQWPGRAVDYLFSIIHNNAPVPDNYGLSREAITGYLRQAEPSIRSIASALPALLAQKTGKSRWIEKTPDHLLSVRNIRQHFPDAPIIRIMRDPRDVALSLEQVPWGPKTFLEALIVWRRYHRTSEHFFTTDKRCCTMHFEALVASPGEELHWLCQSVHISFEPDMLDTSQAAGVNKTNEPWKNKVTDKVDKGRAHAWKDVMNASQKHEAEALVGQYTDEKSTLSGSLQYWKVRGLYGLQDSADLDALRAFIAESGVRFWQAHKGERTYGVLFIGNPDSEQWLGGKRSAGTRMAKSLMIAAYIAYYRLHGRRVAWQWGGKEDQPIKSASTPLLSLALSMTV